MTRKLWIQLRSWKLRLLGDSRYSGFVVSDISQRAQNAATIENAIRSDRPLMVARLGATELEYMVEYMFDRRGYLSRKLAFVGGAAKSYDWDDEGLHNGLRHSGIFPKSREIMQRFCERMFDDMRDLDILGSWQKREALIDNRISAHRIPLQDIEPYYHRERPWTRALSGKRVVVVHPFAESIQAQYAKRELLFPETDVLPDFHLRVVKAVQSISGLETGFDTWFDALKHMEDQLSAMQFDVVIIGCGAYGFPLAGHVKRMGRQAVHLGGPTQILFGIKGKRWETHPYISSLINPHWVRPLPSETPDDSGNIVYGSYW